MAPHDMPSSLAGIRCEQVAARGILHVCSHPGDAFKIATARLTGRGTQVPPKQAALGLFQPKPARLTTSVHTASVQAALDALQ